MSGLQVLSGTGLFAYVLQLASLMQAGRRPAISATRQYRGRLRARRGLLREVTRLQVKILQVLNIVYFLYLYSYHHHHILPSYLSVGTRSADFPVHAILAQLRSSKRFPITPSPTNFDADFFFNDEHTTGDQFSILTKACHFPYV